ncbi:MAG: Gfo/Idh/MocA family oxidoreductase [Clostridiales bacterium]|jgi:predicted dehydrogenase|nr:Gfo/Idh/MocA family oxidoreductase [Clostridiales bacterium]
MKLKIAVAGVGYIARAHIAGLAKCDNLELAALVTRNPEVAKAESERLKVPCYPSIREACAAAEIDIVDICTPTYVHEQNILEAVSCQKHVICEKPITLTLESFGRIRQAVEDAGVKFMVAQVLRFWPEYMRIRELYDKGLFGNVKICHAKRLCELPQWQTWFRESDKSGGAIYDLMLHDLDFVQNMFGDIESVFATGAKNAAGSWNHALANIRFKSGVGCVVEACEEAFGHFPFTMGMRIFGDEMILNFQLTAGHNIDEPATSAVYTYARGSDPKLHDDIPQTDPFGNELAYFADCILRDVPTDRCSIDSSEKTLKLVLAIKESLETGKLVAL